MPTFNNFDGFKEVYDNKGKAEETVKLAPICIAKIIDI
jgi:hypothetical protein